MKKTPSKINITSNKKNAELILNQSLRAIHPSSYISKLSARCREKYDIERFYTDLDTNFTGLFDSKLYIEENVNFATIFGKCPEMPFYIRAKTLLEYRKYALTECMRICAEMKQIKEMDNLLNAQSYINGLIESLNDIEQKSRASIPQNPAIKHLREYGEKRSIFMKMFPYREDYINSENAESKKYKDLIAELNHHLDTIDNVYESLDGQNDFYVSHARFSFAVEQAKYTTFQPEIARTLDEYKVCGKIIQNILNIQFINGNASF